MRSFLIKALVFTILLITLLSLSLFYIPDPISRANILSAVTDKHQLLQRTSSPKIILVGGSNVAFGFNSKRISEAYGIPVVNTAIHAGMGLRYYVNDVKPFIKSGDIVVLMPEYSHFFTDKFDGNIVLVSVLFDAYPEGKKDIPWDQWMHLLQYLPDYAVKKIMNIPSVFRKPVPDPETDVYARDTFNEFGDAYKHWTLPNQTIPPEEDIIDGGEKVSAKVLTFLGDFDALVKSKGATLVILPPVFRSAAFRDQQITISTIAQELQKNHLPMAADPARYKFADDLFFDTNYHPNKTGVEKRTTLVIEDLAPILKK